MRRLRLPLLAALVAVAGTVLLLAVVEGLLRLTGYGHSTAFTVPCTVRGRAAWCDNDRFTRQFFPPGAFRLPAAFAIPAEKRPGTFRIFVVGESAAEGDPEPSYSFARYLEVMLRDRYPAVRFEVINTGIAAINSHALLPITRDVGRRSPDLFIFYAGNNEVVGPYGPGTSLTGRGLSLPLIRAAIRLNSFRLAQLVAAAGRAVRGEEERSWTGMAMFTERFVPADAPGLARVYEDFRHNLRDMVAAARRSGARVVVSTVGVNLRNSAPFGSVHREGLSARDSVRWDAAIAAGDSLAGDGRHEPAIERFLAAAAIDSMPAALHFRIARSLWSLERFRAARSRFQRARELDALRFRADEEINAAIRAVATEAGPGVELLDGEAILAAASPHGVPGHELFYEHVHLRPEGNYLLARALFPTVSAMLPDGGATSAPQPSSRQEAERLLALTEYDRRRVGRLAVAWLSQPPFTAQLTRDEEIAFLTREIGAGKDDPVATAGVYRDAIARAPDDRWLRLNYGSFLESFGELAAAEVVYRKALELLPGNYLAGDRLAGVLARMGKHREAIAECRALLRRMPYHPTAWMTLGYALAQTGEYEESVESFERAARLHPAYAVDAYTSIGVIRLQQERYEPAAAAFRMALERNPTAARRPDILRRLRDAETRGAVR